MPTRFSPIFDPASSQAAAISGLFVVVLAICAVILAIVIGMVGISLIRFRQRPGSPEPPSYFGNRKLEIIWTAGPALIIFWLFVLTARGMRQSDPADNRQPDITVVSHQWWWEARYPQPGVVIANEIHIPVGAKWLVRLESADVIHDFWVPRLARKMDVIPGNTNYIWLEPSTPGNYAGTCAEYCGAQHAWMRFSVIVESPEDYAAWLREQENPAALPTADSARQGAKIFQSMTCVNCHSISGASVTGGAAPDLTHLAGRALLGGGILPNSETNLFRWLKNPQRIKPSCLMPNLNLTDAQASALANYLESLK